MKTTVQPSIVFTFFVSLLSTILVINDLKAQINISGIVNTYVEVTAIATTGNCATSGSTSITVTSTTGFSVNDRVLIIQMKGATADETNTASFGDITSLGNAGNYEFATISSIAGVTIVTNALVTPFNTASKVQLIRVPIYASANVTGLLTGQGWNGTTGGVLAIEVTGALTLSANVSMSALGYAGGANIVNGPKSCGFANYYYDETGVAAIDDNKRAAFKGEGIADFVNQKRMGKGKWTNGGGGGNSQNAGGGGGSNVGVGGRGGRHYDACAATPAAHGLGGTNLTATASRLFMGGGGGAGDNDDTYGTRGGNGGGIILIYAASITPNGYTIAADGETGPVSPAGGQSGRDGMGGGGGGGTIAIECGSYSGSALALNTNGGGGSTSSPLAGIWNYHGPGGGAGGGLVWLSTASTPSGLSYSATGGIAGYTRNQDASRSHYEATDGSPGTINYNFIRNMASCAVLPVTLLSFDVQKQNKEVLITWVTTTEINSAYFSILRSTDGIHWSKIGKIAAQGNSSELSTYTFIDNNPVSGINYYKLIETDMDNKQQTSEIKSVSFDTINSVSLYPNPSTGIIDLNISSSGSQLVILSILNMLGQELYQTTEKFASSLSKTLDLSSLAKGVYLVSITSTTENKIVKLVLE